jgi:6-phosphogluconate dehydrogenase (decarboxylating)
MSVGFIGLGRIGQGLARNLLKAGVDLVVFGKTPKAMASVTSAGAEAMTSMGDVTRRSEVLFTSLPGSPEVEPVVFGADRVVANMRSDQAGSNSRRVRSRLRVACTSPYLRGAERCSMRPSAYARRARHLVQ